MDENFLLEDPDGAPYPEEVQKFIRIYHYVIPPAHREEFRANLVNALESVAKFDG